MSKIQLIKEALMALNDLVVAWLIRFDSFFAGHKTFLSMAVILIGLYVMPEGKAQYIVATAGVFAALIARAAKKVNE